MLTSGDLRQIRNVIREEVDRLRKDMSIIKKDMKVVKRTLNRAAKDIRYMSGKFDEGIVYLGGRVAKIEKHLKLPTIEKSPAQN